jgi:uncharacterized iron-regulated protein
MQLFLDQIHPVANLFAVITARSGRITKEAAEWREDMNLRREQACSLAALEARSSRHWPVRLLCLLAAGLLFLPSARAAEPVNDAGLPGLKRAVIANYADMVFANCGDSLASAKTLQDAIAALLAAPSEKCLEAARQAWRSAHQADSLTETYRFYDGPIDQVEALVNS